MQVRLVAIVISIAVFLLGCATRPSVSGNPNPKNEDAVATVAAIFPYCPRSETKREKQVEIKLAPIVAALAPILLQVAVEAGINFGAQALKETAEGKVEISTAAPIPVVPFIATEEKVDGTNIRGWKWNNDLDCIVVARGKIGDTTNSTYSKWSSRPDTLKAIGLVDDPDLYFEAKLQLSADKSAYYATPMHFEFNKKRISSMFSSERDILVAIAIDKAAAAGSTNLAAETGKILNGSTIKLEDVRPGTVIPSSGFVGVKTQMVPLAALSDQFQTVLNDVDTYEKNAADASRAALAYTDPNTPEYRARVAQEAVDDATSTDPNELKKKKAELRTHRNAILKAEKELAASKAESLYKARRAQLENFLPINITVAIAETKDADKFLLALASALEGQKQNLIEKGVEALKPKTAAEKLQDDLAQRTKILAALQAENLVAEKAAALEALKADPNTNPKLIIQAEGELNVARFNADTARLSAGLPTRYGSIISW